ncbi:MAG: hypothetical protein A2Z20_03675 [Bdellovibrionales bacterium RBG_16_40_8]|nr:MAG: hypothetical protein A2Z20_03675 [Bdellovibrionales bacterium RBG_16_40_8]
MARLKLIVSRQIASFYYEKVLIKEAKDGINDWKRTGYGGPLYALDTELKLDKPTKAQLEEAMRGHVR